jgi:hypothetical protein
MELTIDTEYKERATGRLVELILVTELPTKEVWIAFRKRDTNQEFTITAEQFKRDFEPLAS